MIARSVPGTLRAGFVALMLMGVAGMAQAALFGDDEARTAILELRQRVDTQKAVTDASLKQLTDDNLQLRRSMLDLQNQIETLRGEVARLRGQDETVTREQARLAKELADAQRLNKGLEDRLKSVEPQQVSVDGREFVAGPGEKSDYDAALALFRSGDFAGAQTTLLAFAKRYPKSGYYPSVLFWLGNAQYATRDYKEAVANFRNMLTLAPDHARAPEAMLSIANCQIELKDPKAARRTLEDLIRIYPQSEATQAAKDRLARIR